MTRTRTSTLLSIVALLALFAFPGCKGKTGPMGPAGPAGATGPKGDQGLPGPVTRTVMTGHVPAGEQAHFINIPGLDPNDPPLVSVFVGLTPPEWDELPVTWSDTQGNPLVLFASVQFVQQSQPSGITLYFCDDLDYIIVILD